MGTAFIRDLSYRNAHHECRSGDRESIIGSCQSYKVCLSGHFKTEQCPQGLAFNPKWSRCDWATTVPACAIPVAPLPQVSCSGKQLSLAGKDTPAMQEWIQLAMNDWWKRGDESQIRNRPEGKAALSMLHTAGIEVKSHDKNGTTSRWAIFSEDDDRQLTMQAVALVEQIGPSVNVMAIVSRRAFIKDEKVIAGAGKALLKGILDAVHTKFPDKPLTLLGTPGDKYVEQMYRLHGMKEYGREESGMPKLRVTYPAHCLSFITSAILCTDAGVADYLTIAFRLIPGSFNFKDTCAHLVPPAVFMKRLARIIGF